MSIALRLGLLLGGFAIYHFYGGTILIIVMLAYLILIGLELLSTVEEIEKASKNGVQTAWDSHREVKDLIEGVDDRIKILFGELFPSPAEQERRRAIADIDTKRQGLIDRYGVPPE